MKECSRRNFIKGMAASAATLAVGGLLAGCATNEAPKAENQDGGEQRTWDKETDVLILGAGGAGMCAGYEATQAGAKALILEKAESFGGTSIRSGGIIQASGTAAQKKADELSGGYGGKSMRSIISKRAKARWTRNWSRI